MTCCSRASCATRRCSRWSRWLTDLHPWWKGVLQEDASCATILALLRLRSIYPRMGSLDTSTWRHWMMMTWVSIWSLRAITSLKMMTRNSLTVWMLLSSCSSRIEEIVHALESTTTLPWDFTVFVHRVLELNIWKSREHLVSSTGALSHLVGASRSRAHISSSHSIIHTLPLLHLGMCSALGCNWVLMACTIASSRR